MEYVISLPITVDDQTGRGMDSVTRNLSRGQQAWERFKRSLGGGKGNGINATINVVDRASGAARRVFAGLKSLASKPVTFLLRITDRVTAPLRGIVAQLLVAAGIAGGIGALIDKGIESSKLSATMEQTKLAFETMLKSKQSASSLIEQMQKFANKTPFEFPELAQSTKLLLAFKFQAKDIIPIMTAIGDASSMLGAGSEGINRLVRGLGQMKAKGKVSAEELLQLTEVGVPALNYLKTAYRLSAKEMDDINKALVRRGVTTEQAINTILAGMRKDYGGGMAAQSVTLLGLWSTIKDTFKTNILTRFGDGLNTAIIKRLQKIAEWIDKNPKKIEEIGNTLARVGETLAEGVLKPAEKFFGRARSA